MLKTLKVTSRAVLALLAIGHSVLLAQDDAAETALVSGPAAGTELTPVRCYATDGPFRGKEFDAAEKLGSSPCALLFVHELTRNTAPVVRGLDDLTSEFSLLGFNSFTILLTGDRTAGESQLKRVNGSLRLANPIVLGIDGAEGPGNYALNRKAALTLVFARDGKVVKSMALTDTGPNDVPVIREAIEELAGKIPEDPAALRKLVASRLPSDPEALKDLAANQTLELQRLRAELKRLREGGRRPGMQRQTPGRPRAQGQPPAESGGPSPQRQGRPPKDPELNSLLRSFIRPTNNEARADEIFAEIKARAAQSEELKNETVEMFKLMLSFRDRYGTKHAQELAETFLREQKPKEE